MHVFFLRGMGDTKIRKLRKQNQTEGWVIRVSTNRLLVFADRRKDLQNRRTGDFFTMARWAVRDEMGMRIKN